MNEQPEALRITYVIEGGWDREHGRKAAAELRRQHDRINTLETSLRQALAALENSKSYSEFDWVKNQCGRAITAAGQALGEQA